MKHARKQCAYCGRWYEPDPHAAGHQKACSRPACRRARRRQKLRSWRTRNPNYLARAKPKARAWAKAFPDYWRHYRRTHPAYVRRDSVRRVKALRAVRRSANETGSARIVVEKLRVIESLRSGECSANETGLSRRVGAIEDYLLSSTAGSCSAKETGIAAKGVPG